MRWQAKPAYSADPVLEVPVGPAPVPVAPVGLDPALEVPVGLAPAPVGLVPVPAAN